MSTTAETVEVRQNLPLIIPNSIPAFAGDEIIIPFQYPIEKTEFTNDERIEYKILNSSNNRIAYGKIGKEKIVGLNLNIPVPSSGMEIGSFYKIQVRYYKIKGEDETTENNPGTETENESTPEVVTEETETKPITEKQVSEWSTVCYVKRINIPKIDALFAAVAYIESPTFYGVCEFDAESKEEIDKYAFILKANGFPVQESGWLQHNVNIKCDSYIFPLALDDFTTYTVVYKIKSVNGFEYSTEDVIKTEDDTFTTAFELVNESYDFRFCDKPYDEEQCLNDYDNGCIKLVLEYNKNNLTTANIILRRTSEKSNYEHWEDLQYDYITNLLDSQKKIWYDYTVEHGISYLYGVQVVNSEGQRGPLTKLSKPIKAEFEDIFLVDKDMIMKIRYNPKVSNFKRNLLEIKQDTIGNKYPFILKNGNSNYFSFSLGGLISKCIEGQIINQYRQLTNNNEEKNIAEPLTSLSDVNIYNERIYREKIEKFLTNGKAKLFKSATEGNKLVYLIQTSLTPEDKLGRMLYSFTTTAYEIADSLLLNNMNELDVISIGKYRTNEELPGHLININFTNTPTIECITAYNQEQNYYQLDYLTDFILTAKGHNSNYQINNNINGTLIASQSFVFKNPFNVTSLFIENPESLTISNAKGLISYITPNETTNKITVYKIIPQAQSFTLSRNFNGLLDDNLSEYIDLQSGYTLYNFSYLHITTTSQGSFFIKDQQYELKTGEELIFKNIKDISFMNGTLIISGIVNSWIEGDEIR